MDIETVNPSTGNVIKQYSLHEDNHVMTLIEQGHQCFQSWRVTTFACRAEKMTRMAELLRKKKLAFAKLMACEMGKPMNAGMAEIEKCALVCEHYAAHAEAYLYPREIIVEQGKRFVHYLPMGIVFAIMPWNFPFWQVFRFAAPTIMSGNAVLLKHAPISTGTGEAIAELFIDSGFPPALFQQLIINEETAARVIAHPHIVAVTLTGSERAGRAVASCAGSHLKKCVLELGGNDPYIVLADADLTLAAQMIVASRLNNTGQVCIAAKRIIVVREVENALIQRIQGLLPQYQMGDPLEPQVSLGPMARLDLRATVHQQVLDTVQEGATLLQGGVIPDGPGFFYPPTILTGVRPGMRAFDEEVFGPVFTFITAKDERDAIMLANQSQYGLAAAIFTQDLTNGQRIALLEIETGTCYLNQMVVSDPRIPFGGIKSSGFGRELSKEGILEFVNTKTLGY